MNLDQQIDDYVAAWELGEQTALNRILRSIPDDRVDEFLERTASRTRSRVMQPPSADSVSRALGDSGMAPRDAQLLSILATGTFVDWVRAKLAARGDSPLTVAELVQEAGESADESLVQKAVEWLEALEAGEQREVELDDDAVALIAAALDASPQTIVSLMDRDVD